MLKRAASDERGSIAIAVTVMFVLALLSVGVLARSMSSETQTRRNQDFNAALAGADAGIADALFQLDQDVVGAFGKTTDVPIANGDTFRYQASQLNTPNVTPAQPDPNRYLIHASGTVNGVRHNVMVTAKRRQRFDYVFFAMDKLDLNGSCDTDPVSVDGDAAFGPVGSNGVVKTSTNCTPKVDCFLTDAGVTPPKSNGCGDSGSGTYGSQNNPNPNGRHINEVNTKQGYDLEVVTVKSGKTVNVPACPWSATGNITGNIPGSATGYYECDRAGGFTLTGNVNVTGGAPAIILLKSGTLSLANNANVNSTPLTNPASNFQIYVKDASTMAHGNSTNFVGAMYAPTSSMRFEPNGGVFNGSLIASTIEVNGAPNLGYLDQSLTAITVESWKITEYREVPSTCPISATTC